MDKRHLFFISSLLLFSSQLFGQTEEPLDSLEVAAPRSFQVNFYFDYGKLFTLASDFEKKYEGGIEFMIKDKFPIILEIGSGDLTPAAAVSNGSYNSQGNYFRIGGGYTPQVNPDNRLGFTFRYGQSSFDESFLIVVNSPTGSQPSLIQEINRQSLSASWAEVVLYSDKKINNLITLGLNLRLRMLLTYDQQNRVDEQDPIDVYSIPGYGRSFDKVIPAANLFLKITL